MRLLSKDGVGKGDLLFLCAVILLAAIGLVFVYSASYYNAETLYGDQFYFLKKQVAGFVLGLGLMAFLAFFDCRKLQKIGIFVLVISIVLLAAVFIPGVGKTSYGATRWISIGGITIQPSEIAKYGLILFTAGYFAKDPARMRTLKGVLPVLIAGGCLCALIISEPNMSVTMLVGAVMIGMIFLSGVSWKAVFVICVPILVAVPALVLAAPYRLKRLSAFLDPWASPKDEGYQLIQSLYALANGNFFGTGLFASRQKYRFLPFSESDFILSIIAEETGFFGVLVLFALVGVIIWRGFRVAKRSGTFYEYMLATGITFAFAVQVCLNAMVVSGCIPPTGLPFPLVSSGNTSLIVTMGGMGIVYSISRRNASNAFSHKIKRQDKIARSG